MEMTLSKKRILIVEDDSTIRGNLAEIIEMLDHEVFTCTNGREASEVFDKINPHLIICDIMMPEMNGFDFLQYINLMHPLHTSIFVFLTAKNDPSDLRLGMNLGADDYITKPFNLSELQEIIHNKLKKQERIFKAIQNAKKDTQEIAALSSYDDFNNNLNNIAAGAHYLKFNLKQKDDLNVQAIIQVIEQSGLKLQRSINNYLFYNDWVKGKITLKTEAVSEKLIRKSIRSLTLMYLREEDLILNVSLGEFEHDAYLIKKIIEELSENAFKYSKPGTAVVWSINQVNSYLVLDLTYASTGFDEKYYHEASAFKKNNIGENPVYGLGLGLILVKEITKLLQADVRLKIDKNIVHYTIELKQLTN